MERQKLEKADEGSLTRRAVLTFFNSILSNSAQLIVGFIVTPIIIRGLGAELYGAWMMIKQAAGYTAQADLRPIGTLKFTLAVTQHIKDLQQKRRQIGAAIYVWGISLPIIFILGVGLYYATPMFFYVSDENIDIVKVAMMLTILRLALERILSLPDNVLRGMNLHYKATGINAALVFFGGILSATAISIGLGLPGVAGAGIIAGILIGCFRYIIAKKALPWFGAAVPRRKEFFSFFKLSGWLMLSGLAGVLFNVSDFIVIGIVLSPSVTAIYATTGAVVRMLNNPLSQLISSGAPGVAGLCGEKNWIKVTKIRKEMYLIGTIIMTVIGVGVIILNKSFLYLWVGDGYYAGNPTNMLLVLVGFMTVFFRIDSVIVDSLLLFRKKAVAMIISGLFAMTSGAFFSVDMELLEWHLVFFVAISFC